MSREGDDGGKRSPWGRPKPAGSPGAGSADRKGPARAQGDAGVRGTRPETRQGDRASATRDATGAERGPARPPREAAAEPRGSARSPWQGGAASRSERPRDQAAAPNDPRDDRSRSDDRAPRAHAGAERRGPPRERGSAAEHRRPPAGERNHDGAAERPSAGFIVRGAEQKICGLNAARAAFAARPEALRKVYLSEARIGTLRELLAFCVANRLGYRVVEDEELERISGSSHHEGVCLQMLPRPELDLDTLLQRLPRSGPVRLLWLDGVGNPHNLGAVLRSAAHFGVHAVLLPPQTTLTLSAAAARVAEGGAEHVPLVHLTGRGANAEIVALETLADAGFVTLATLPADAPDLYALPLPQRAVFVLGAEGEGMQKRLVEHCERRVCIPGSGRVESLNIANAVAVLLAEHWRQHPPR
jgi:TrmH RNA methyltransferase